MSNFKRYDKYKDSGIEWIGEIPEGWETAGFTKYISSIVDYRGKTPEKVDEGVFLITAKNIKNGCINYSLSQEYVKPEDYEQIMRRGLPEIGDVLFTTEAPLGEVANIDSTNVALAQRIIKFRGKELQLNNYYLKYWIMSHGFQYDLKSHATGSTATGIKASKLSKLIILLPSFDEQISIANFLDQKTAEIDDLIADKEKLIELLQEKRQAVITEAVTKGLNPNVKMKDSGIEWIGEIPEGWEVRKLKFLSKKPFLYGANEPADLDDSQLPRYIRITDINEKGELKDDTFKSLLWEIAQPYLLKDGDILFARSGATVGKTFIYKEELGTACFAGYLIKYEPDKNTVNPYYIYYFTLSRVYENWVNQNTIQATIQNLSAEKYGNLYVSLPPLEEQNIIVEYLSEIIEGIEVLIENIQEQIQKLREYRQSLIFETVTGKIDVRDYASIS